MRTALSKFVHEKIDVGTARADQLRERHLIDQIRREQLGRLGVVVKRADDARFGQSQERAFGQRRDCCRAQRVSGEALLAAETAGPEDCDNGFLSRLGDYLSDCAPCPAW
jgi:hypothetical protein